MTGSVDGFVEVWDCETCKLRTDLEYQASGLLMRHEEDPRAVLSSAFSRDGEFLATGSQAGTIRVWKVKDGACSKKFVNAHPQGITALCFSKDSTNILSASFDGSLRLHGIRSGKALKEFRGHGSYVNAVAFSRSGEEVVSGSSDGTVRLWDLRTSDCLLTVRPGLPGQQGHDVTVLAAIAVPHTDTYFVVTKSSSAHLLSAQGETIRTYRSGGSADFLCACVSPQGKWAYCLGEDGLMCVFDLVRGTLEDSVQVTDRECIAVTHHPHRNLLVTLQDDGQLKMWKG